MSLVKGYKGCQIKDGLAPTCDLVHQRTPQWQSRDIGAACMREPVIVLPLLVTQHVRVPACMPLLSAQKGNAEDAEHLRLSTR